MVEIIPSILTDNVSEARDLVTACDGVVRRVQIDIVDGIFAKNKTILPENLFGIGTNLGIDFHLMTDNPILYVEDCIKVGADRVVGQIELMPSQEEFVSKVQAGNLRVGLAIDLATPVTKITPNLLELLDVVLLMSVPAGFGGQKFDPSVLKKIEDINALRLERKLAFRICVDGGEVEDVIDDSVRDGADEIVIGRRLFNGNIKDNIKKLQEAATI